MLQRHLSAFGIKFLLNGIAVAFMLPFVSRTTFPQSVVLALVIAIVAYLVGDLVILPGLGNTWTVLADIGIATAGIWLFGAAFPAINITFGAALGVGIAVGVVEFFFHALVKERIFNH